MTSKEAFEMGYVIIYNREEPEDGFGFLSMWQWLYPDGSHHGELPNTEAKRVKGKVGK